MNRRRFQSNSTESPEARAYRLRRELEAVRQRQARLHVLQDRIHNQTEGSFLPRIGQNIINSGLRSASADAAYQQASHQHAPLYQPMYGYGGDSFDVSHPRQAVPLQYQHHGINGLPCENEYDIYNLPPEARFQLEQQEMQRNLLEAQETIAELEQHPPPLLHQPQHHQQHMAPFYHPQNLEPQHNQQEYHTSDPPVPPHMLFPYQKASTLENPNAGSREIAHSRNTTAQRKQKKVTSQLPSESSLELQSKDKPNEAKDNSLEQQKKDKSNNTKDNSMTSVPEEKVSTENKDPVLPSRPNKTSSEPSTNLKPSSIFREFDSDFQDPELEAFEQEIQTLLIQEEEAKHMKEEDLAQNDQSKQNKGNHAKKKKERLKAIAMAKGIPLTDMKPRWRWQLAGESNPDPSKVLKPYCIFRAVALLVYHFWAIPSVEALKRKGKTKEREAGDTKNMLKLYVERTNGWLSRITKTPIHSIVQNPKLLLGVEGKQSSLPLNRFQSKTSSQKELELRMIRLKVRVQGVIEEICREQPPSHIISFLRTITQDGIYFPDNFLFPREKERLDFNALNSTRKMMFETKEVPPEEEVFDVDSDSDTDEELKPHAPEKKGQSYMRKKWLSISPSKNSLPEEKHQQKESQQIKFDEFPKKRKAVIRLSDGTITNAERVKMLVLNFIFVRVLLPGVIMTGGIKQGKSIKAKEARNVNKNLKYVASVIYFILRMLNTDLVDVREAMKEDPILSSPRDIEDKDGINDNVSAESEDTASNDEKEGDELKSNNSTPNHKESGDDVSDCEEIGTTTGSAKRGSLQPRLSARERSSSHRKTIALISRKGTLIKRKSNKLSIPTLNQVSEIIAPQDVMIAQKLFPESHFDEVKESMIHWMQKSAKLLDRWLHTLVKEIVLENEKKDKG